MRAATKGIRRQLSNLSISKGNGESSTNDHHHSKKSSRDESAFGSGNDAPSGRPDDLSESRGRKADDGTLNVMPTGTRRSRSRKISLGGRLGNAVQSVVLSTKRTSRSNRRSVGPDLALPPLEADEASTSYNDDLKPPMTPTSIGGTTEETSASSISVEESTGSSGDARPKIERSVSRRSDAGDYLPGGTRFANNASAAHRGYLDRKIKRKQWERYWCILYDSCLYCYNTPLSDVTRHKTMLRGYTVVADVRNLNKSRFTFRLERKDVPSLHFSTGNHQDFLLWVGILEKETSSVQKNLTNGSNSFGPAPVNDHDENYSNRRCSDNISDRAPPSPRIRHRNSSPASLIVRNVLNQSLEKGQTSPSTSADPDDSNTVWKQKFALLEEIFDQKNELVKEKMMLEQKSKDPANGGGGAGGGGAESNNDGKSPTTRGSPTSKNHPVGIQRRVSREAIINQYENAKTKQDVQMAKRLAFLNRRRNSTQLKLDHCIKELAPRGGKKRIDDPMHFSALENRQKELRSALCQLDTELNRGEAHMRCDLVKLQQKRDLELMVLEHTEMCDIIHKHYFNEKTRNEETWLEKYIQRRRLSNDSLPRRPLSATAAPGQHPSKNDALISILEKGCDRVFPQSNCSSASDLSELKSPEFWKRHFSANGSSQESGSTTGSADGMPSTPEDKMAPSPIQCEMIFHGKGKVERRHSSDTGLSSDADSGFQHLDTGGDEGSDESGRRSFGPVPFVTVTDVTATAAPPSPVIQLEAPPSPPPSESNCVVGDVSVVETDDIRGECGGDEDAKAQKKISWMEKVDAKTLEIIEDFENFAAKKLMTLSSTATPGESLGS